MLGREWNDSDSRLAGGRSTMILSWIIIISLIVFLLKY